MNRIQLTIASLLASSMLSGCDLSPDFSAPEIDTPGQYKSSVDEVPPQYWQDAIPYDAVKRGEWWKVFHDEVLNTLQTKAAQSSPTLAAALERKKQASAAAGTAFAEMLPEIDATLSPQRSKISSGSPGLPPGQTTKPLTSYKTQGIFTYELDLFGRLSGQHTIAKLSAEAEDALYQSALLSLQADVAQMYFSIRALDAERALLGRIEKYQGESLRIAKRLHEMGETSAIELAQAESEYATAQANLLTLDRQRDELENALAVLIGALPSQYHLPAIPLSDRNPPVIPAGIPSTLLARRPDVSAAIRQIEAANRQIGVARSAFFPRIVLTAVGGYTAPTFGELFKWSNRAWTLGPGAASVITQPVFEGGRIFHEIDRFEAQRGETVANYRQQVLTAFKEVEDSLNAIRLLAEEAEQQRIAAEAARKAERLAITRYETGDISYNDSLQLQQAALNTQRGLVRAQGNRWIATIDLIRALGGSWEQKLPSDTPPPPEAKAALPEAHDTGHLVPPVVE